MSSSNVRTPVVKDERERRRRIRESVRNYYEVESSSSQSTSTMSSSQPTSSATLHQHGAAMTGGGSGSSAAVAGKNAPTTSSSSSSMDLDSTSFNPTSYTTALMRTSTLPKLLETDTVLRHSVKSLDKELQDLVYSNYAKFISAAETIKEVRSSVNDMQNKLQDLDENVAEMEKVSSRVTRELERHRHLVDQEVATNSMLRKVQFLVMLPQIMASAAQAEKWMEAANYWAAGDIIFTKYSEFPSFVRTQSDCRLKAEELYVTLSQKICDTPMEASQIDALSVKLSALRLLACTTVDLGRLQQAGAFLVPTTSTPAVEHSPSRFTSDQVMERARAFFHKKIINTFQEQTHDTVAHIKLDFLHRREDLERHGKKVQQSLRGGDSSSGSSSNDAAVTKTNNNNNIEEMKNEVKASLVDLSLALRKRYIAKVAEVISKSFQDLLDQMNVVDNVCGQHEQSAPSASAALANFENASEQQGGTSSSPSSAAAAAASAACASATPVLESALARFLDEVCSGTITWMQECLSTFTSCIVNAANVHSSTGKPPHISAGDVDTTVNSMCETFFEAIMDTEKTFCSISRNYLRGGCSGARGAGGEFKQTTSTTKRGDMGEDGAAGSDDNGNASTNESASPNSSSSGGGPSSSSCSTDTKFKIRVAKKTQQLLVDLEAIISGKIALSDNTAAALPTMSSENSSNNNNAGHEEDNAFLVPILCFAAIARTSARLLPKSSLASSSSWLRPQQGTSSSSCLTRHTSSFFESAVSLADCFVRNSGLRCVSEVREVFCVSNKFGTDAVDPIEPSELFVNIVQRLRRHLFIVHLLLSSSSSSSGSGGSGGVSGLHSASSSTQAGGGGGGGAGAAGGGGGGGGGSSSSRGAGGGGSSHHHSHHSKGPFTAQFMRRDVVVGLKADMDRMFAARAVGGANSNASGGQQMMMMPTSLSAGGLSVMSGASGGSQAHSSGRHHPTTFYGVAPAPTPLSSLNVAEVLLMYYLTALVEIVREHPLFSRAGFQQLQVDASLLMFFFSELRDNMHLLRHEECSVMVVNELACCAFDRTRERAPLPNATVEQMAAAKWKTMR